MIRAATLTLESRLTLRSRVLRVAYAGRWRRKVADDLQMIPKLGHGGPLQLAVNATPRYRAVPRDVDSEEPDRVLDRELMIGFRSGYEGCIVGRSNGCSNEILQALIQIH